MAKLQTYFQLKVEHASKKNLPLTLTFINGCMAAASAAKLREHGYEVEMSPAYKLFRTVDEAMEAAEIYMR